MSEHQLQHELEQRQWSIQTGQYFGEISALCFLPPPSHVSSLPLLLVGTGSQVLLYDLETGHMEKSFHVFDGVRVHGISCNSVNCKPLLNSSGYAFEVAIFGEKRVKLFSLKTQTSPGNDNQSHKDLNLTQFLPKFSHWVLDACFLKDYIVSAHAGTSFLAVGCSDNSVSVWDISQARLVLVVKSPDKCLLYSMRLWSDGFEALRIASGTIYNEIIIWKIVKNQAQSFTSPGEICTDQNSCLYKDPQLDWQNYKVVHIYRLTGHEGSIFRIAWSSDGSKLVSASDDRCARIWTVPAQGKEKDDGAEVHSTILYGHTARVWDCYMSESLIITTGEDCTCRVWGVNGDQLETVKEHTGRGIWRCLYDPSSSLLVTAGFDSSIKVHRLDASLSREPGGLTEEVNEITEKPKVLSFCIPNSSEHIGQMDRSEYVRCLHFASEDVLYVATNNGYLHRAKLLESGDVKWSEIICVSEEVPIICMDLFSNCPNNDSCDVDDWVAVGDGKGSMTIVRVVGDALDPKAVLAYAWSAGMQRQLLGTYWCKSLGKRYIFTTDPRGILKLWRLCHPPCSLSQDMTSSRNVFLVAEFTSPFGIRTLCLDASLEAEVLVCGDLRGNMILFPLSKELLMEAPLELEVKVPSLTHFKRAHGISSVSSIAIASLRPNSIEICSTGADGCICSVEYDKLSRNLKFLGLKQVKNLSLIRSVIADNDSVNDLTSWTYAVGFASANFIVWNLITETKIVDVPCGGWRRPHSFYLGHVPEMKYCFAYVKNEIINVHRHWVPDSERRIYPQNLHTQFHGREIHSICFVFDDSQCRMGVPWVATGCEDGTVRLTRYSSYSYNCLESKLLGEHVGGSAVRSIFPLSKVYAMGANVVVPNGRKELNDTSEDMETPYLLISVGAKRVLTSWIMRKQRVDNDEEATTAGSKGVTPVGSSSMSFQWLSTDMPAKRLNSRMKSKKSKQVDGVLGNISDKNLSETFESILLHQKELEFESSDGNDNENDWRYMAVNAFLVKCEKSRLVVCFVVIACSDATLTLRAVVLPHRLWFDVAVFTPVSSPVLALQQIVTHAPLVSEDQIQSSSRYILISGSTDGNITFWDLTQSVEAFMQWVSTIHIEKSTEDQKRPQTGRGSQGGRWWRSSSNTPNKRAGCVSVTENDQKASNDHELSISTSETAAGSSDPENNSASCSQDPQTATLNARAHCDKPSFELCEVMPLCGVQNVHQSGVNCLHISSCKDFQSSSLCYNVLSGGDDQALHCIGFDLVPVSTTKSATEAQNMDKFHHHIQNQEYRIRFLHHNKVASAHSSAVKGVWTDGIWVFSTGLDQRLRCWRMDVLGKLSERTHLIISVPEPETLDARACGRNCYQIAVAGRGMQMLQFSSQFDVDGGECQGLL